MTTRRLTRLQKEVLEMFWDHEPTLIAGLGHQDRECGHRLARRGLLKIGRVRNLPGRPLAFRLTRAGRLAIPQWTGAC